jgi:hypothetical protein
VKIMTTVLLVLLALQLSGCGKRARFLDPPDADAGVYPKHYPPKDDPGTHL